MTHDQAWWVCAWGHVFSRDAAEPRPPSCPGVANAEVCGTAELHGPFDRDRAEQVAAGRGVPPAPSAARVARSVREVATGRLLPERAADWAAVWVDTGQINEADAVAARGLRMLRDLREKPIEDARPLLDEWLREHAEHSGN